MTGPTLYTLSTSGTGLDSLVSTITSDVGTMLPIGVGLLAIFLGIDVIKKILFRFF